MKKELRIPIASVEFRTDFQVFSHQLRSSHIERPDFVKSRLDEILRYTTIAQWFHVDGKDNIADDATRDFTPAQFLPNCRWLSGPSLTKPEPATNFDALTNLEDPERPTTCAINQLSVVPDPQTQVPQLSRPSMSKLISRCRTNLSRLKRDVALSLRQIQDPPI